jgi:hypothetical protein
MESKKSLLAEHLRSEIRKCKMDIFRAKYEKKVLEKQLYDNKKEIPYFQSQLDVRTFITGGHEKLHRDYLWGLFQQRKQHRLTLTQVVKNLQIFKKKNKQLHELCDIYHIRVNEKVKEKR